MTLRETGETLGYLGFHGGPQEKTVELGYDIPEANRNQWIRNRSDKSAL